MSLIAHQEALKLISLNDAENFTELLNDNCDELKLLYPNTADICAQFKEYIESISIPIDVEMHHQFIRISRLYRNQTTIARIQYPLSIAQEYNCKTIMDFGGGGGTECIAYAKAGLSTTYADKLSLKNTDTVHKRFEIRNININMVDGDILPNEKFDIITAFDVLEHIYDVEHYISELLIRLHWDGFFIVYPDFDNIIFDGDHLEKNVVYRDIFQKMMATVGLEKVSEGPSVEIYRKIKSIDSTILYEKDGEVKRALYMFVKNYCDNVINESITRLENKKLPKSRKITSKLGLTDLIRSVGKRIPLPQQLKRKAFTMYRKSFDESLLDKITDFYTVHRIVEYKLRQM